VLLTQMQMGEFTPGVTGEHEPLDTESPKKLHTLVFMFVVRVLLLIF
jgi:hypothetical protein